MANILDKYGIKEVADVIFYKIDTNGDIQYDEPVLFLDTLKVSTIEQTAENVSARGGRGNPELITWDYGKEITVTLEDALFSAKSMAFMFGSAVDAADVTTATITKAIKPGELKYFTGEVADEPSTAGFYYKHINKDQGYDYEAVTTVLGIKPDGTKVTTVATDADLKTFKYLIATMQSKHSTTIKIDADKYPGTYAVVGDTYARSQNNSTDEFFQFIIHKAKVTSEVTLTLEAEGDPTTFNMNLRVLRPDDGAMMELIKYDFES